MFGAIKMRLGMVEVTSSPKFITVEGISTLALLKDIQRVWGSSQIAKYMFSGVRSGQLKILHFFGLDFLYICQTLYADSQSRTPRRVLKKVMEELKANTWIGDIDRNVKSITDMSIIDTIVPFPLKPFQHEFVEHFGKMVPTYRLKGYMLDAGAGTGKSVADLVVGECLHANKVVIVSPKNAIERVWEDTIKDILIHKRKYWISGGNVAPSLDDHYFICHYESLENLLGFIKANPREFKGTFVILDESHNFNRIASDRTQFFIELCKLPQVDYCLWASGTPIQALGIECIPFLRCVDPMFNEDAEERFRKIYGRDAKRANDILRNRIGHLKYHVPKQDVVTTEVTVTQIKVQMPGSEQYTLEAIGEKMRAFIAERNAYYTKNYKLYADRYYAGLKEFEQHVRTDAEKRAYITYTAAIKLISSGFDPKTMKAESQLCNQYEQKTIIPLLPNAMKPEFKSAKSVVKYVALKVLGECLGTIVGGMRTKCHVDMVQYIDFSKYIDDAKKKTLVFTSYVEVLTTAAEIQSKLGYTPAMVYGATNKDLASIIKQFFENEDINPLNATFQSLSTAVPLTVANNIMMLNQPFREAIRTQTIARAARLGQDENVTVWDFLLDTGDKPNISTRSNDILEWSGALAASILSVNNVDLDTLTLECRGTPGNEWMELLAMEDNTLQALDDAPSGVLPPYLYHGSAYSQDKLQPGFNHSGELVKWDNSESNKWLYTSDDREDAIMLGISSAIEKKYPLDRYSFNEKTKSLTIEVTGKLTLKDITSLQVVLYTLKPDHKDGWMANYNPANGIDGEYKTQRTVDFVRKETIDVAGALRGKQIKIVEKPAAGESFESFSDLIRGVKTAFGGRTQKQDSTGLTHPNNSAGLVVDKVSKYLGDYFDKDSWLKQQQLIGEVSSAGVANALVVDGKFPETNTLTAVRKGLAEYKAVADKYKAELQVIDAGVQRVHAKYSALISAAIKRFQVLGTVENEEEIEELVDAAVAEFKAIPTPMIKMAKFDVIGGIEVFVEKRTHSPFNGMAVEQKKVVVKTPDRIKGLSMVELKEAARLVKELLDDAENDKGFRFGGLDHSDGDDFNELLGDFSDSLHSEYLSKYYHQNVSQDLIEGFPDLYDVATATSIALLTWMDRSVK